MSGYPELTTQSYALLVDEHSRALLHGSIQDIKSRPLTLLMNTMK